VINARPKAKSKAICEACGRVVSTTADFRPGSFPFGNAMVSMADVLAYYCDDCGTLVALPHGSGIFKAAEEHLRNFEGSTEGATA